MNSFEKQFEKDVGRDGYASKEGLTPERTLVCLPRRLRDRDGNLRKEELQN